MTTYAQVHSGIAHNVIPRAPEECFPASWIEKETDAGRPFSVVPDGTKHGARDNGNGTFTNPASTATTKVLTSTQFHALAASIVGTERLGDILLALEASTNGNAKFAWQRYTAANAPDGKFIKSDCVELFTGIVALTIMTATEATNILAAWPSA